VYYGYHDVTGRRVAPAELIQDLSRLRRSDVIRWIAALAHWVSEDGAVRPEKQMAVAKAMLTEELGDSLRQLITKENPGTWSIFHRRQLWFMLQVAVLSCTESAPSIQDEELRLRIGECCLKANDILQQIETKDPPTEGPEGANRWMTGLVIPFL